jgi:glycine/D-amino acid oxidase-like deaminating enzyme
VAWPIALAPLRTVEDSFIICVLGVGVILFLAMNNWMDLRHAGRWAFLVNRRGLPAPLYGFPDFGDGIKAAFHGFGDLTEASHLDREIDLARDVAPVAQALERWMPGAAKTFREATPCMYALSPDENFVIDRHPEHTNLILCGGFSGHGFKFAPVVGEIAAGLALDGGSRHGIEFLSLRRFLR